MLGPVGAVGTRPGGPPAAPGTERGCVFDDLGISYMWNVQGCKQKPDQAPA